MDITNTIANLEQERTKLLERIQEIDQLLEKARAEQNTTTQQNKAISETAKACIDKYSPVEDKIKLFKSLFQGRQDVFARRFESSKTGKSGYQPVCENEWKAGICEKPRVKCSFCSHPLFGADGCRNVDFARCRSQG